MRYADESVIELPVGFWARDCVKNTLARVSSALAARSSGSGPSGVRRTPTAVTMAMLSLPNRG